MINLIKVGKINTASQEVNIRGYDVTYVIDSDITNALSICGSEIAQSNGLFNHVQFRWLQTVVQTANPNRDVVYLDSVTISSQQYYEIFADDFDDQTAIK